MREAYEVARVLFPKVEHVQSPPPTREGLLKWAAECRSLRPKERREQVLRVVEESRNASEPISVAEIFEAAYSDPGGQEYWCLWLKYEQDEATVAKLLAVHFVAETAAASHPLGSSWEVCCHEALARHRSAGQVVDRLRAIVNDEEWGYIIPPSACAFLDSERIMASDPAGKHPGGAPPQYDRAAAETALYEECKLQGSVPHSRHSDKEWRTKADAYKWLRDAFFKLPDGGPSESWMKTNVGPMLPRIARRLKEVGN